MYVYMLASGASELRKFSNFAFQNCYFFQYFVGTSDTSSVQMTCLPVYTCTGKFPNIPTKLRKSIMGGGGGGLASLLTFSSLVQKFHKLHLNTRVYSSSRPNFMFGIVCKWDSLSLTWAGKVPRRALSIYPFLFLNSLASLPHKPSSGASFKHWTE